MTQELRSVSDKGTGTFEASAHTQEIPAQGCWRLRVPALCVFPGPAPAHVWGEGVHIPRGPCVDSAAVLAALGPGSQAPHL